MRASAHGNECGPPQRPPHMRTDINRHPPHFWADIDGNYSIKFLQSLRDPLLQVEPSARVQPNVRSRVTAEATLSENGDWQSAEWVTPTGSRGCPLPSHPCRPTVRPSSFSNSHLCGADEKEEEKKGFFKLVWLVVEFLLYDVQAWDSRSEG